MTPQLHKFTFRRRLRDHIGPTKYANHHGYFLASGYAGAWAQAATYAGAMDLMDAGVIDQITAESYRDVKDVAIEEHEVSWKETEQLLTR